MLLPGAGEPDWPGVPSSSAPLFKHGLLFPFSMQWGFAGMPQIPGWDGMGSAAPAPSGATGASHQPRGFVTFSILGCSNLRFSFLAPSPGGLQGVPGALCPPAGICHSWGS